MGINELSDDDITNLESVLFTAMDKIKLEKASRIYKDEIMDLKSKLSGKKGSKLSLR